MKRFENAQIGDRVYSRLHGRGQIMYIDKFILKCRFDIKNYEIDSEYFLDGRVFVNDVEPILFYSDSINNYLTERPEPKKEINWQDYEGKEIEVLVSGKYWESRILIKYDATKKYTFICENYANRETYSSWEHARLIEEKDPEIDWSNVPEGTVIIVMSQNGKEYNKPFYTHLSDKIFPILTKDNLNGIEEWKKARLKNGTV